MRAWLIRSVLCAAFAGALAAPGAAQANPHTPSFDRLVADSGFRPELHGFSFQNYGRGLAGLSSVEMRRLFGNAVCAAPPQRDGTCPLTPPAREWMDEENDSMEGGHCYGFSVLALRFHSGDVAPREFEAQQPLAAAVPDLRLLFGGSSVHTDLVREIAYSFVHQDLDSVEAGNVNGTPAQILDALVRQFKAQPTDPERYGLSIFKRDPKNRGGHEITPFAVEDLGGERFAILVYDNNYPKQTRAVIVDRARNTWNYEASPNPAVRPSTYEGDATTILEDGRTTTLALNPMTPGLGVQPCSFCATRAAPKPAPVPAPGKPVPPSRQPVRPAVSVSSAATGAKTPDLLIKSRRGAVGKRRGKPVKRLKRARVRYRRDAAGIFSNQEPQYSLPAGEAYTIELENTDRRSSVEDGISVAGPGFQAAVDGIRMRPGQLVRMRVSADGSRLSFSSDEAIASPQVRIGLEEQGADHAFTLERRGRLAAGEKLVFDLSERSDELSIEGVDGRYDLVMRYVDGNGEKVFAQDNVATAPHTDGGSGEVTVDFGGFDARGGDLRLEGESGEQRSVDSDVKPTAEHDKIAEEVVE